ncbi:MAG TPA: hypothetical protein VNM22_18455 [Candidatus Limnocylindrales bacterium]|nr:hypothetical protein [Candidatus Limnocylindrales bacterium]
MKSFISILVILMLLAGGIYFFMKAGRTTQQSGQEVQKAMERVHATTQKVEQKAQERGKQMEEVTK